MLISSSITMFLDSIRVALHDQQFKINLIYLVLGLGLGAGLPVYHGLP